jgi:site-specific recombinase XerC
MSATRTAGSVWTMLSERWHKTLIAKGLSPLTIRGYQSTVRKWAVWLDEQGYDLEPEDVRSFHVDEFIADVITATSPANAAFHYRNLRVYFAWLVKREEVRGQNPMSKTDPPIVPEKVTPLLTDDEHARVLEVCAGRDFISRRDTAIILLFIDTGLRVSELSGLQVDDIDLTTKRFAVRGKGGKVRFVGFGNSAGLALARYLKERDKRDGAALPDLWVSRRDTPLKVDSVKAMLNRRGRQSGLTDSLYAHRFRHDFSHRWQDAGGSEHGLMLIAGWSSTKMPRHYGKQAAAQRALKEQQRIGVADRIA